ncbi:MAG: MG2 domain-containing protein [Pseudomonadota bacterium]
MMRLKLFALLTGFGLIATPIIALSDAAPQVTLAVPGTAGGNAGVIDRFTLRFSENMVPLGDPRAAPPVGVTCPVGGTGRWVDPQTFVHEFASALPGGLTCAVKLRDDLKSARGVGVTGQRAFTIDTGGPSARAVLPGSYDGDIEEDQVFLVATNTPPARQSVASAGYCAVDGIGEKIALDVLEEAVAPKLIADLGDDNWQLRNFLESAGLPQAKGAPAAAYKQVIAVKCRRPLPPGKDMALVWASGIADGAGRQSGRDQRFDFTVRKPFTARFECSRTNPQAGCNPVEPAYVRFTAPISADSANAVRLKFADGTLVSPKPSEKGKAMVNDIEFSAPLPPASKATLILPAAIKDESGRALANAERFPLEVRVDEAPPLVKFAANFGIVEAKEGGVLPVTVRAVEPALARRVDKVSGEMLRVDASDGQVAQWLRDLGTADDRDVRTEKRGKEEVEVNYTGTKALLDGKGEDVALALPGKGKDFEVVGIPLKNPGFYVVELASPKLGRALLGRDVPRYVAAGALVTNMAVHFKWGREASLAWVTALDSGKSVSGANVRVTDSCTGTLLARGTSDAQGRFLIKGGLPAPETYGDCTTDTTHPLMISARKPGDFSFTLTAWSEGIRPYDFDLNYGYSAQDDIIHTVFDRTLIKAGDTINMKHILRRPVGTGFALAGELKGILRLSHSGSGTEFDLPLSIGKDGIGETTWTAPQGAPQGDYGLSVIVGDKTYYSEQNFRVDEFRLPTMRASVSGPKTALVRPKSVPLDLFIGFLSGGGAPGLPVSIRTAFASDISSPEGWEDWTFGGRAVVEGIVPLNGEGEEDALPLPLSQTLPVTLGGDGTARTSIDIAQEVDAATAMTVEMDYEDANGETLTASQRIRLLSSGVMLGVKTDGWLMRDDDLRLKLAVITPEGKAVGGRPIKVAVYSREILTARRRLIGGFYAYDNQARTTKLDADCSTTTDKQGLASCALSPDISGEVIVVATTTDSNGNIARSVRSVWLAGEDEWWFGGDNGDRMDIIPEAKSYKAGETAKFQVRMPFRAATALVTVEREGVLSSFVTELSGKDPVIEVPMPGAYAPDVYVSVLAVRGRIGGFKLWLANIARNWGLPFLSREGAAPTALVDLAKPSYRLGIAKVKVGWEAHQLGVTVKADKQKYAVRETASIDVAVTEPGGKPAKSAEIAFAAVDEALLQLQPNESWKLIDAMMGERPISVLTSTAQMQVVGKRTYGKKAVTSGGGGGGDLSGVTRDDFRPVLLWRGRVALDAAGRARIPVALSESLSAFRMVAIASSGVDLFGTGEASVRTAQDLQIFSGLPPLVRSGDFYGASFTLRNASDKAMTVTATVGVTPSIAKGPPLTVTIPAGGAVPVTWNLTAPENAAKLDWRVEAKSADGKAVDQIAVSQAVIPAVPVEIWAATLARVGAGTSLPLAAPAGTLSGTGFVDVKLSDSLAPPLAGVRSYMGSYPYSCFEQRLSRAVVLGDAGAWTVLGGDIPAYMDSDGLLRYFPMAGLSGSEALTAYVLSMTAEAGFIIPQAPKARMIEAMKAVVDGRLKRENPWAENDALTRIAALAALARVGEATPAILSTVSTAPADMPTSALVDWITAIDRTKGANTTLRETAERTLRQRIIYEGSRLDLADKDNAAWWMMTSTDETGIKALLTALGRPGWSDEAPKMMVGVSLRQRRGHWDTTPANAWGTIAARRFASLYPASAVTGTTSVSLNGVSRSQGWPMASGTAPLRLPLTPAKMPLLFVHNGGAGPWAMISVSAAVPLKQPLFAGYKISKTVIIVSQKNKGRFTRGDVIKVRITVDANAERNWVVVSDPVPPGATIIGNLGGQSGVLGAAASDGEGVSPSYVERGNDAWRGYFEWVPRGQFVTEYALRLNGSGRFTLPPTRVEAMYSPDIRGSLPNAPVVVGIR